MKKQITFLLLLLCFIFCAGQSEAFNIKTKAQLNGSFVRPFWQKQGTAVQGTWLWGNHAEETNYASLTGEAAGDYYNSTHTNLDEYKWGNIFLTKGTYKITIIHPQNNASGIAEVLLGTTSLSAKDLYAGVGTYNNLWEITFTLTSDTTADLRFRVNGKNVGSSNYYISFARFFIGKVG